MPETHKWLPFFAIYGRDGLDGPDGRWRESHPHDARGNGWLLLKTAFFIFLERGISSTVLSVQSVNRGSITRFHMPDALFFFPRAKIHLKERRNRIILSDVDF